MAGVVKTTCGNLYIHFLLVMLGHDFLHICTYVL